MPARIEAGLDILLCDPARLAELKRARVGLLAHAASVTSRCVHAGDALLAAGVNLCRLFGPEHGIRGDAQAMESVDEEVDAVTGIPTVSLYGECLASLYPEPEQLLGLDVMIIDVRDIGTRYYTYAATACYMVEACTRAGIRCIVVDRPNPLGAAIEGPGVMSGFASFVGAFDIPNRHGLTLLELLELERRRGRELSFEGVHCSGWRRDLGVSAEPFPWVMPSPNMPTVDTALVYPGMCLLEGTEVSEGRGTTRPFELFGAPWVDSTRLVAELDAYDLPGVYFRSAVFVPTFEKHEGERCYGAGIHVHDPQAFDSLRCGAAIVHALARHNPGSFAWRAEAYEFVDEIPAIDLLFGSSGPRDAIDGGADWQQLSELLETPSQLAEQVRQARHGGYG